MLWTQQFGPVNTVCAQKWKRICHWSKLNYLMKSVSSLLFQVLYGNTQAEVHFKNYIKQSWLILQSVFTFETVFIPRHFFHCSVRLSSASRAIHWRSCHTQMKTYSLKPPLSYNYLLAARFSKDSWHRRLVMHLHWWFTWSTTAECSHSISTAVDFWKSACCCLLHSPVAVQQVVTSFVQICMLMMSSAWRPVEDGNIQPIQLVNSYIQNVTVNNACQQ